MLSLFLEKADLRMVKYALNYLEAGLQQHDLWSSIPEGKQVSKGPLLVPSRTHMSPSLVPLQAVGTL